MTRIGETASAVWRIKHENVLQAEGLSQGIATLLIMGERLTYRPIGSGAVRQTHCMSFRINMSINSRPLRNI
jgi:hypothetical protein